MSIPIPQLEDANSHQAPPGQPRTALRKDREGERLLNEGQDLVEHLRDLDTSDPPRTAAEPSTPA